MATHRKGLRRWLENQALLAAVARDDDAKVSSLAQNSLIARGPFQRVDQRHAQHRRLPLPADATRAAAVSSESAPGFKLASTSKTSATPWYKIAAGVALGLVILVILLLLLLLSPDLALIVGSLAVLFIVVFLCVNALNPAYFYRRRVDMVLTSGLAIHSTGAGSIAFTVAWVVIIAILIRADHNERF